MITKGFWFQPLALIILASGLWAILSLVAYLSNNWLLLLILPLASLSVYLLNVGFKIHCKEVDRKVDEVFKPIEDKLNRLG